MTQHFPARRLFRAYLILVLLMVIAATMISIPRWQPFAMVAAAPSQAVPEIEFSDTSVTVVENAGTVSLEVQMTAVYTADVSVNFKTIDGSARAGSDFQGVNSGSLTIPTNNLTGTIQIVITNDTLFEGTTDEDFTVLLFNPSNAVLGNDLNATVFIDDDESAPTATPTSGTPTTFADVYEPNNTLGAAYTIAANDNKTCNITLWPTGDEDYFRFVGKAGLAYQIFTSSLTAGLDTELFAYDTQGSLLAQNDDISTLGDRSSKVTISASVDGFYYARVINRDPSNPAGKTYCIEVDEVTPPTPTPSQTPVPGADDCEYNSELEFACILEIGEEKAASFVPVLSSSQDTDIYKIWMRQGSFYTCETFVNDYADTNMIFLDLNGNDFQPNLGNNDKEPADYGSKLSIIAPYTGWLHILVGPVVAPPYEESFLHQYDVQCVAAVFTPTPEATPTSPPAPFVTQPFVPTVAPAETATPFVFPTFPPTATPIDLSVLTPQATPTPPVIQIQPLPTATPAGGGLQNITINVTLYYDSNFNFLPELNEGIMDVAVALYDSASGNLIAFGSTNEAGTVSFASLSATGAVRVVVPFLSYSQVVAGGSSNILLRVAPQPLPIGIP